MPAATEKEKAASADGLLRLSTPTETSTSNAQVLGRKAGSEGSSASSEVLQNELGIAQEELDRSKRENLELKAKLAGLEAQLSTTSKLLELENDELKAVQLGVSSDDQADQASSETDGSSSQEDASVTAVVEAAPVVSDSPVAGDKRSLTEAPVKGPLSGLFAFLQSNWVPLLGLVVVLLGVLLLVAKSKKEDQSEQVEPFLSPDIDTAKTEEESSFAASHTEEEPQVDAEPAFSEPESEAVAPVEVVEEVDPIGEADIYLSLGNFSEAESVIETAIEAAPNDSKLHLKRLDLFAAQQDAKGFDAYYPTLVALGDEVATATADRLRGNIQEEVFEAPVETTRELTLEEQVAEELGIEGFELDLSDTAEPEADTTDDLVAELDELALESDLESSFVDSDESGADVDELLLDLNEVDAEPDLSDVELDLSEIELDLKPAQAAPQSASEESDESLEDALFGDISLPDELDDLSAEIEIDLPDIESDELELPELASDEIELPDLASVELDLQDTQLESEDDEGLELSLDSFDFDSDDDLDLEVDEDESNTQLELAQAYVDMGDESGAKDILAEVLNNGSDEQKQQANELLAKLS